MELNMTETEMLSSMKDIKKERDELKHELDKYENYFSNKRREKEQNVQRTYIGKCFRLKSFEKNNINAFKILSINEMYHDWNANCVALIKDGDTCTVSITSIFVFGYQKMQLMHRESDPKFLDMYKEISQQEFESLYHEYIHKIGEEVYEN